MARRYFGTDGIRGRANRVITPELALKVGQAAGLIFRNGDHKHRVLIGKDHENKIDYVVVQCQSPMGTTFWYLSPEHAKTFGEALVQASKQASSGLVLPQGLVIQS